MIQGFSKTYAETVFHDLTSNDQLRLGVRPKSSLDAKLKEFIERVFVPRLVRRYLRESGLHRTLTPPGERVDQRSEAENVWCPSAAILFLANETAIE